MTSYLKVLGQDLPKNNKDTTSPEIELVVVNNDTLFTINRKFAEVVAIQFDSLKIVTEKLKECTGVLNYCIEVKDQYKLALEQSQGVSDMLKKEIEKKDRVIQSYKKIDESQQAMYKDLNIEFKKAKNRNKWLTGLSIGGVTVGFTSILLLLIK